MKTVIYNARLIDHELDIPNGMITLEDGFITAIHKTSIPQEDGIDAKGAIIIPALLDTHTHGIGGYDFNLCSLYDLQEVEKREAEEGVGGYLASLVVESHEDCCTILERFKSQTPPSFLGIHLEGPYLNKNKKAVMKEEFLRSPNLEEFKTYCDITPIVSMTIAPELEGAYEVIQEGIKRNVVMSIGHSDATAQQVVEAQEIGVKGITHLYNAMTQHEHRNPGVVTGAILSDLYCELIADGFHVHPDVVNATYHMIGKDRIILISDANPCKGMPDGDYSFSGKNIIIEDGKAVVKETGRIAGSTLSMQQACKNMMEYCGCTLQDVVTMAAYNPANLYQLKRGSLKVGYYSDVLLVDEAFHILQTFLHLT